MAKNTEKYSLANKKRWLSKDFREKFHKSNSGEKHWNWKGGKQYIKKGRIAWNKGKKHSQKTIEKMKLKKLGHIPWNKGKLWSEDVKNKMRGSRGGNTPERTKLFTEERYKIWRLAVFERDNFICQMPGCYQIERKLQVHHIKSWKKYSELRYDKNNGITLCRECHRHIRHKEEKFEILFNEIVKLK